MEAKIKIGMEIHVRIDTERKLFSFSKNSSLGRTNSRIALFDLGIPGSMPHFNKRALYRALQLILAMKCKLNRTFFFDRKHYRYPDLPLGFQITQFHRPLVKDSV